MLNVYEQVDRNKRRSMIIIAFFVAFVISTGGLISHAQGRGWQGIILSLIISATITLLSYFKGDQLVLALHRAHPVTKDQEPLLFSVVENLSFAAQIPMPQVYVVEVAAPNAFAYGRDPQHSGICVTRGLLNLLEQRSELEGVIGHEITHIKNLDNRLFLIAALLIGSLDISARFFLRWHSHRDDKEKEGLFLLGFISALFSPFIGELIKLAISRQREFFADAGSAMLTRQPQGLISALNKISRSSQASLQAIPALAHFYIISPLRPSLIANLFNTHPPIEKRIAELKKML